MGLDSKRTRLPLSHGIPSPGLLSTTDNLWKAWACLTTQS